jgi:hypothetical protein
VVFNSFNRTPDENQSVNYYKHVGIYAYKYNILKQLIKLSLLRLKEAKSWNSLRWLENDFSIYVTLCNYDSLSIDTPEDLIEPTSLLRIWIAYITDSIANLNQKNFNIMIIQTLIEILKTEESVFVQRSWTIL